MKRYRNVWWLAVVASRLGGQQPEPVLTLEACWKLAEAQYSLVERARLDERAAGEQVRQARAGFLPQLAYLNAYTYNTPRLEDRSTMSYVALNGIREYVSQPTVTQEIDLSGRLRAELQRGRAGRQVAEARTLLTRRDLRLAVREAYYAVLEAQHNVATAQRTLDEAEAFHRKTQLMAEQGEAARADVIKAEVQLAGKRRDLWAAQTGAVNAGLRLKSFWTEDLAQPPRIEDTFLKVPEGQDYLGWDAAWVARRGEFSLLGAAEQAVRAEARLARSDRRPTLNLVYAYGIDANQVRIRERGQAAFATLRIPLFDWGRSKSRERQAQFAGQQIDVDRHLSRRLFTAEFYTERNNVDLAVKQMAEGRREVELARESLRLARLRYDGGEAPALEVVEAQNTAAGAELAYNQAVFQYHMSRARLEVATGQ